MLLNHNIDNERYTDRIQIRSFFRSNESGPDQYTRIRNPGFTAKTGSSHRNIETCGVGKLQFTGV